MTTNQNMMKMYLYMVMIMIISMMMTTKIHPMYMILMLIMLSILVCLSMTWSMTNPMLSIILFMIMISGVLIMFLYFSSLISNEQTKNKLNLPIFISIMMMIMLTTHYNKINIINNEEMQNILSINVNTLSNIKMIYMYPYVNMSMKCMMYLIISMFTIIKVCSFKNSSLRKINN